MGMSESPKLIDDKGEQNDLGEGVDPESSAIEACYDADLHKAVSEHVYGCKELGVFRDVGEIEEVLNDGVGGVFGEFPAEQEVDVSDKGGVAEKEKYQAPGHLKDAVKTLEEDGNKKKPMPQFFSVHSAKG